MLKRNNRRWRLLADLPIQGGLLLRLLGYWMFTQLALVGTVAMFDFLSGGEAQATGLGRFLKPACFVSFLVLLISMLDMLCFSNRFVGPMVNLRGKMKRLAQGKPVKEVSFRRGDFYQDVGDSFNEVRIAVTGCETNPKKESLPTMPDSISGQADRMVNHV